MPQINLEHDVLDLLVDGPCPFSGLFRTLRRMKLISSAAHEVARLWKIVCDMDDRGLIGLRTVDGGRLGVLLRIEWQRRGDAYRVWLPSAGHDELSVDKVGVWVELLAAGREEWMRMSGGGEGKQPEWMIDVDGERKIITVHARSAYMADEAVEMWLRHMPSMRLVAGSAVEESVESYELADGSVIKGGVRKRVKYVDGRSSKG
jgi:hypothetical protein